MLRWTDSLSAPASELPVEIVEESESETTFRAALDIGENTPVTLVASNYMVNGIVRSCRADRNSYLITIAIQDVLDERSDTGYFRDPGALIVDDFLTEEEEAKILESLEDASRSLAGDFEFFGLVRSLRQHLLIPSAAIAGRLFCCPVPA